MTGGNWEGEREGLFIMCMHCLFISVQVACWILKEMYSVADNMCVESAK